MLNPTEHNPAVSKPALNSATLTKALTKPPPLSSLLNSAPKTHNGSLSTANSSLSPSPSLVQQQSQPLVGSTLIAQSQKSAELSSQSLNSSIQNLSLNNPTNQLPSTSSLFQNLPAQSLNKSLPHLSTQNSTQPNGPTLHAQQTNNTYSDTNSLSNSSLSRPQFNQPVTNMPQQPFPYHQQPSSANQAARFNQYQPLPQTSQNRPAPAPLAASTTLHQQATQLQAPSYGYPQQVYSLSAQHNRIGPISEQNLTNAYVNAPPSVPPFANMPQKPSSQMGPPTANQISAPPMTPHTSAPPLAPPSVSPFANMPQKPSSQMGPPTANQISAPPMTPHTSAPPLAPPSVSPFANMPQKPSSQMGPPTANQISAPPMTPHTSAPPLAPPSVPPFANMPQKPSSQMGPPTGPHISAPPLGPPIGSHISAPPLGPAQFAASVPGGQAGANYPSQLSNGTFSQQSQQGLSMGPVNQQSQASQMQLGQNVLSNGRNLMSQYEQKPMQYQQLNNIQMRSQPNAIDLLREKKLVHAYEDEDNDIPRPLFPHEFYTQVNCHPDTVRCTLSSIPESQQLLNKSRLPLGLLIHPFKDLESLKVVQSSIIVRCRNCRSYINPFVNFLDNSKWRCNLCYSINDLPEEFLFDPVTRSYGDPSKRPEINSSTIEFIAPPEYTLRPPPPAMYLYLLDVSHNAINTGYLKYFCETIIESLDKIPGDSRAQIGFVTYSNSVHFYNLSDAACQTKMFVCSDLEDIELPMPDGLMVNLNERREGIQQFLDTLPSLFAHTCDTDSALGSALTAAYQLLKSTGGRMTIMQTCLPNVGVGALKQRDENVDKDSTSMAPQTDFYKKLALDCAGVQIAVDLFMLNSLNADLATLSCVSKYCGGEVKYYPGFHPHHHPEQIHKYCMDLKRYLTRKIGFEAVMRIRCTRGLAIHTFHGNFFVRSTDLLALPNVNPDAGFGMQINIEESLSDISTVCFQAAVLYTSSKSERRIRIHTYCLPVTKNMNEIVNGADQEAIAGLISKMAVDRTTMNSLKDARDAMINVAIDYLQAYKHHVTSSRSGALISPYSLRLIPTFVLALMKNLAFKFGSVKLDDRIYAMNLFKTLPLKYLMLTIYPNLYAIHNLDDKKVIADLDEGDVCIPPRMHLSSENIDRHGLYLMDCGEAFYMWVGRSISDIYLNEVFNVKSFAELPEVSYELPDLENELSEKVRQFIAYLYDTRPYGIKFLCFREGSHQSSLFFQHLHDDKTENSISYFEFLKHLSDQLNS